MRWLYATSSSQREAEERARYEEQIALFWTCVAAAATSGTREVHAASWEPARSALRAIDRRLTLSPHQLGGAAILALSSGPCLELRPLIDHMCAVAPELDHWRPHPGNPPLAPSEVDPVFLGRLALSLDELRFEARPGDHRRLDLAFFSPSLDVDNPAHEARAAAAARLILGDAACDRWLGEVTVEEVDADEPSYIGRFFAASERQGRALEELPRALQRHTHDQRRRAVRREVLRSQPWMHREYKAEHAPDYPGHTDVTAARTCHPELWDAAFSDLPFFSDCFGPDACVYLKLERTTATGASSQAEVVGEALGTRGLGAVFGVAEGHRYDYVHLLIDDPMATLQAITEALQPTSLAPRSWLLFHNSELAAEWLPLHPDAPPPPD
jgi:hypothetical protein